VIFKNPKEAFLRKIFSARSRPQAFLLAGTGDLSESEHLLIKFLNCEEFKFCKNCSDCREEKKPDLWVFDGEAFRMEDAKEVHRLAALASWNSKKTFLIKSGTFERDSQTVLLKTLEEPNPSTHFIISALTPNAFLPTLLSRVVLLEEKDSEEKLDPALRKKIESGASAALGAAAILSKDRRDTEEFLNGFELWLEEKIKSPSGIRSPALTVLLEDFFEVKTRFYQKTYFNRMLLEHLIISKAYIKS